MWRRGWLLIIICFVGCTCESDEAVLATTEDGSARLEWSYDKELEIVGAGGHGFACIFPAIDEKTVQSLEIVEGPRSGTYRTPKSCVCPKGEARLRVADDRRSALVQCHGSESWDLHYIVKSKAWLFCLEGEFETEPDFADLPSLPDALPRLLRHGYGLQPLLIEIEERHGVEALAVALAETVEVEGLGWRAEFEDVPEPHRERVYVALRDALAAGTPSTHLLDRSVVLGADDRPLVIDATVRLHRSIDDDTEHHVRWKRSETVRRVMERLARERPDDLHELACELLPGCSGPCAAVFATTDGECDGDLLRVQITSGVCLEHLCDEGLCTSEELEAEWGDPREVDFHGTRNVTALWQFAAHRRPEMLEDLETHVARRTYDWNGAETMCSDREETDEPCRCFRYSRNDVCRLAPEVTEDEASPCRLVIDDENRTFTTYSTKPVTAKAEVLAETTADAGDVGSGALRRGPVDRSDTGTPRD